MKMFFQTSAETDGIMKKGAITNMLTTPLPPHRLIGQQGEDHTVHHGDQRHTAHQNKRDLDGGPEGARANKAGIVVEAGPPRIATAHGQVVPEGKPDGGHQQDQYPGQQQNDRGGHHQACG
jgi:hypothetical protein